MISKVQSAVQKNIFTLCGEIDICLRQMKPKSIFICGLSRSGKSTLFNNINNVTLMGVVPQKSQQYALLGMKNIDVEYQILVENAEKAQAKSGIISVTLLPNIIDKGSYTMIDLAGFGDTRRYQEVIGVSYVLKAAYHKVRQCQFVLVVKSEYFAVPAELFKSVKQFVRIFNFSQMSEESKERLFKSITFVITKSMIGTTAEVYAQFLKPLIQGLNDENYGDSDEAEEITQILTYLSEHHEQFYLFEAAVLNQKAAPSTIVKDHLEKRTYFQFEKQNQSFLSIYKKDIFHLPFKEDFQKIKKKQDRQNLNKDLQKKLDTVPIVANILQKFFKKAIQAKNLLDDKLNFDEEFKLMQKFNQQEDIYPKEFNYRCEGIQQKKFPTIFSVSDSKRPLKVGIKLAQNAFNLYKLFNQWPAYDHDDQSSRLEQFMTNYRDHLVSIITLFRDSFCSTYEQEQTILKFLFITARTCREFSMLYQIRPDGKHEMCLKMKDSFESKIQEEPYKNIQISFIKQLSNNIETVCKKLESQKDEAIQYSKYLSQVLHEDDCSEIQNLLEYKTAKRQILEIVGAQASTPEEALVALHQNFLQHKKTAQEYINKMNDEEEENYPESINFKFIHLLSEIAKIILNLERSDIFAEDLFAYDRQNPRDHKIKNGSTKLGLIIEQAYIAMDIFMYINDVESVCKTYEIILKSIPEKDYEQRVKFLKGLAQYCCKNGRIEQSITLYQKALSVCATGNLCQDFLKIKVLIGEIENTHPQKLKNYFSKLKHKKIIDPTDDNELDRITADIEEFFINPYNNRPQALW